MHPLKRLAAEPKSLQHNLTESSAGLEHASPAERIFKGQFYVNASKTPSNSSVLIPNATSLLKFVMNPQENISAAVVEVTAPSLLINSTGQTKFKGNLIARQAVSLGVNITPLRETSADIAVNAAGTIQFGQASRQITESYYFNVTTENLYHLAHPPQPLPNDPLGKNATLISLLSVPIMNLTATGQFSHSTQRTSDRKDTGSGQLDAITIFGQLAYYDENNVLQPIRNVKIALWNECFLCGLIVAGESSSNGSFVINLFGYGGATWHFSLYPESNLAEVRPCPIFCWYEAHTGPISVPENSIVVLGTLIPQWYNTAWEVHQDVLAASNGLVGLGAPRPSFRETLLWPCDLCAPFGGSFGSTNPFTDPAGTIYLPPRHSFPWRHWTVHHEYGHALMINIYGIASYPCALSFSGSFSCFATHTFESVTSGGFALSEGWGEFMQSVIDFLVADAQDRNGNIENNTWLASSGSTNGNIVEGAVASIFWDMVDPGYEFYSVSAADYLSNFAVLSSPPIKLSPTVVNAILSVVFPLDKPRDMLEFFNSWNVRIGGPTATPLCYIYIYNGINPPACRAILGLTGTSLPILLLTGTIAALAVVVLRRQNFHTLRKTNWRCEN